MSTLTEKIDALTASVASLVHPPQQSGAINQVSSVPPGGLWLDGITDLLFMNGWTSVSGINQFVVGRYFRILSDRTWSPAIWISPNTGSWSNTNRTTNTFSWVPPAGVYTSFSVIGAPGSPATQINQTFVQLFMGKDTAGAISFSLLCQGSSHLGPYWTYGGATTNHLPQEIPPSIISPAPASPAAGADVSITVPTNARWRVRGLAFKLVTSSTTGNRTPSIRFQDGSGKTFWRSHPGVALPLSTTVGLISTAFTESNSDASGNSINQTVAAPVYAGGDFIDYLPELVLPSGFKIVTKTTGILSGDQWTIDSFVVEEWLDF